MYGLLFRHVLVRLDPERAHHLAYDVIRAVGAAGPLGALVRLTTRPDPALAVDALGMRFPSPFGLAAGFDKTGAALTGLFRLGFGHVEVGTVTAHAQPGNPKPRLFRLIGDRAVVNRMGFNNEGAAAMRRRLQRLRRRHGIVGVNLGKSKVTELDAAIEDYLTSTRLLAPLADYLVVNVSSPNTPGLRGLQELDRLEPLLTAVRGAASGTPLLVKIAPDLDDEQVDGVARLAVRLGLAGLVATNTTIGRHGLRSRRALIEAAGEGGLSGAPLAARSLEVLRRVRAAVPEDFVVVAVGGVFDAADVRARLDAGATLVQGYTGFLYEGPLWARAINRGLAARAAADQAATQNA